jgi:hypothetical protein
MAANNTTPPTAGVIQVKISTVALTELIAVAALGVGGARAGYFDAWGIYHPTCVWTIFGTVCG